MPKMTEAQLLMNLPYEFSDFIQGETDQYYCDYAICEENDTHTDGAEEIEEEPEMTMMAAAVSKARIQEYVRMFAQAGISLKMLLPQEMALIELVGSYCERRSDAQKEYCFIDLGYHTSRVIIVRGDRIQAVRQIDLGTFELDMVIADIMDVDTFLADTYKRKNYMDILNHERCQEYYGRLAVEILKVINFYQFTFRESNLDGIYLIGGGANIQPLQTVLEDVIGMPAFPVTTLIPGEHKDKALCATGLLAAAMTLAKEGK
jgi:type IV pilus assembly protein PilM